MPGGKVLVKAMLEVGEGLRSEAVQGKDLPAMQGVSARKRGMPSNLQEDVANVSYIRSLDDATTKLKQMKPWSMPTLAHQIWSSG